MSEFHKTKAPIEVDIGDVTPANIEQLKAINVNTLPGKYLLKPNVFYVGIV